MACTATETREPRGVRSIAAVSIVLLLGTAARAQISPGPLSWPHASLDGTTHCAECHAIGAGDAAFNCLGCHTEIAARLEAHRGLHATYDASADPKQRCGSCHSEHNGREFRLIHWEPKEFDHALAGYPLDGGHAGLKCRDCHQDKHVVAADRDRIRVRDMSRTYLGLTRACAACHQDKHEGRLGTDCASCHRVSGWKTVELRSLDHARTRYPLVGLHATVPCAKCHTAGPDGRPRYAGIAFAACSDCHADPHRGSFPGTCAGCHSPSSWKEVAASDLKAKFDHGRTRYPLRGRHAAVPCAGCHPEGDFKRPLAFDTCGRCHRQDPHRGQFAKRPGGSECGACHTVDGFKQATFTVAQHAETAYPLAGRHVTVTCARCHASQAGETNFKVAYRLCTDCHRDGHGGQFAAAADGGACEGCHTVDGFRPSTFTLRRHQSLAFTLTGSHVAVPCGDCHGPAAGGGAPGSVPFHFAGLSCETCHEDPHRGQFRERMTATRGPRGAVAGCAACHGTGSWRDLTAFDHAATRFTLLGAHRATECIQCHRPPNLEVSMRHVDFGAAPEACAGCHEDVHGGQFEKDGRTPCEECHDASRFKPSTFDHDARTTFRLDGRHVGVPCAGCHKLTKSVDGRTIRLYQGAPKECVACHPAAA